MVRADEGTQGRVDGHPGKSITALIGPSGCGKSTFLKTLDRMNDLIPGVRIEGEVKYNGQDILHRLST